MSKTIASGMATSENITLSTFRVHHEDGILTMEAKHRHDLIAKLHEKHPNLRIIAIAVIINSVPHYFHK